MTKEKIEEAAGIYAEKHAFRVPYHANQKGDSSDFYDDVDWKASYEGFIAGANSVIESLSEMKP